VEEMRNSFEKPEGMNDIEGLRRIRKDQIQVILKI
jgi:hypothetical protein